MPEAAFGAEPGGERARDARRGGFRLVSGCFLPGGAGQAGAVAGPAFFQAGAVPAYGLFSVSGQVVPQVPPVGHLDRLRGAVAGIL